MDLKRDVDRLRLADQDAKQDWLRLADQAAKQSTNQEETVRVYTVADKHEISANSHGSPSSPVWCS